MSNDNRFERVVKLWISVWNLILEQKRHLETVTTILQRIVFEAHGYPKFKDWVAICQLSGTNNYIMKAVGMLDLSKVDTDPTVRQLIAAFPQCFSSEEIQGPIPLSIIFEMAQRAGQKKNKYDITGSQFPVSHNVIPHWIPVKIFKIPSDSSDSKISLV
ncbi:MAG TPA: hypothetical protein VLG69_02640, partial [Candidatus Andersenbacteria bacterium]|nr:hypothetical protein [Candidatus Andersenbacteria bacterium]